MTKQCLKHGHFGVYSTTARNFLLAVKTRRINPIANIPLPPELLRKIYSFVFSEVCTDYSIPRNVLAWGKEDLEMNSVICRTTSLRPLHCKEALLEKGLGIIILIDLQASVWLPFTYYELSYPDDIDLDITPGQLIFSAPGTSKIYPHISELSELKHGEEIDTMVSLKVIEECEKNNSCPWTLQHTPSILTEGRLITPDDFLINTLPYLASGEYQTTGTYPELLHRFNHTGHLFS